jgi:hypothetical protein
VRDIIWTIILVWLVWRIYDAFKGISKMQTQRVNNPQQHNRQQNSRREGEVRIDSTQTGQKSHFKPGDGEYVDYEEIK